MAANMLPVGHGIGCLIATDPDGQIAVTKVIQGGAASFSGQVSIGDKIMSVDGRNTRSTDPAVIGRWFIGEPGTQIVLILRDKWSGDDRVVKLTRQPLERVGGYIGEVGGIGAVLAQDANGSLVVSRLIYGGAAVQIKPSDFFGEDRLKRYDKIVAVDGRSVVGFSPAQARPLLIGPVGSVVRLSVKRAKYDTPIDIELRRRAAQMQTQFVPLEQALSESAGLVPNISTTTVRQSAASVFPTSKPSRASPASQPPPAAPLHVTGEKVGVGLVLKESPDGSHSVKRLKPEQAADKCRRIDPGDVLTHVDGLNVATGAPSALLGDLIAGPEGTVVNLTFQKGDGGSLSINLLRGGPEYIGRVMERDSLKNSRSSAEASPLKEHQTSYSKQFPQAAAASPAGYLSSQLAQQRAASLPSHSEGAVGVSLALDEDYDSLVADAVRLKMWNARLKADLCSAAGCEPQRVQIVGVQRSSGVIVDINFLPGPGLPSADLAAELASQVASPTSILRTSDTTASVQRADVHNGPVAPPNSFATAPKAGASPTAVGRAPSPPQERGSQPQPEQKAMPADKAGVGLVLREDGAGRQVVRRLVPGQSASACAVISVGDILVRVDNVVVAGSNVMSLIPGKPGSSVELLFHRPDLASKDYTVVLLRGDPAFLANLPPSTPSGRNSAQLAPLQNRSTPTSDALAAKKRAQAAAATASPFPNEGERSNPQQQGSTSQGRLVQVTLRGDASGQVVPLLLPGTFSELLASAAQRLDSGELTRVYSDAGVPISGMDEISPGQKLVMHASAKGQFESWSFGLVVKRRFVLKDRLGETGLGQLWVARDTQANCDVVLTEEGDETALAVRDAILAERGQGAESDRRRYREERFLRELQTVQTFRGKNMCLVVDYGLQHGRMFVALEQLTGQTLAEALSSKASQGAVLTEALVRKIACEVLYGLSAADEAGLPHCNLNPSNIFLSPEGVRVMGLGLSGWEPDAISDSSYKLPVKAQPQYMSPEQITGRIVDTRTDIFSLGVVMYRCLTGQLPFDGTVFMEIATSLTTSPTPNAAQNSPTSVSEDLLRIMAKAMSKDPADRYQHAQSMITDLKG